MRRRRPMRRSSIGCSPPARGSSARRIWTRWPIACSAPIAHYGTPVNPAAPDRHPGGSSSGSAVAVAAGLADFALGTDTAGSCRAPAAFCGIFGFRSSHGAISSNGVVPLAHSLDVDRLVRARRRHRSRASARFCCRRISSGGAFERAVALDEAFAQSDAETIDAMRPRARGAGRSIVFGRRGVRSAKNFWSQSLRHFRNLQAFEAWGAQGAWIGRERRISARASPSASLLRRK